MEEDHKNRLTWVLEEYTEPACRKSPRWWLVESIPMTFDEALALANRRRLQSVGKNGRNPIIRIRNMYDASESFVIF